jgi:hypothetical protein
MVGLKKVHTAFLHQIMPYLIPYLTFEEVLAQYFHKQPDCSMQQLAV